MSGVPSFSSGIATSGSSGAVWIGTGSSSDGKGVIYILRLVQEMKERAAT